jgi:chaperonin GroES
MQREIRPIRNFILIKPCPSDEITAGGIIVPENIRERSSKAKVVSVGNGTKDRPMRYRPTYTVWVIKDAGVEVEQNGDKMYLVPDADVLAYMES